MLPLLLLGMGDLAKIPAQDHAYLLGLEDHLTVRVLELDEFNSQCLPFVRIEPSGNSRLPSLEDATRPDSLLTNSGSGSATRAYERRGSCCRSTEFCSQQSPYSVPSRTRVDTHFSKRQRSRQDVVA